MVTGDQVCRAVQAEGITYIPHHNCACCGLEVAYTVEDGHLRFHSGCACSWSPSESRDWQEAAAWINMQDNDTSRSKIMSLFGMTPNDKHEPRRDCEP
jgi:hypothetical protein